MPVQHCAECSFEGTATASGHCRSCGSSRLVARPARLSGIAHTRRARHARVQWLAAGAVLGVLAAVLAAVAL
jgi:hypothetical protein